LIEVCRRIDEMSPNRKQLQAKVKEIQQRILDVGGPGLKRAQAKVDSVSSEFAGCQSTLSAKEVALATSIKHQTKATNSLTKAESDLEAALNRKTDLEEEHREMEAEATIVLQAQERAKQAALSKEKELKEFTVEYRELEATVKVIKEVEVDLRSNYENCSKLLKDNEAKRSGLLKELTKVRKHHEDDRKEYHIFFDLPSNITSVGEEETKGEAEENVTEPQEPQQQSDVIQPLHVYTPEELSEILGGSSRTSDLPRSQPIPPTNKRGKGKKQVEVPVEEEEESGDNSKRDAINKLKGEISVMEADRDRYLPLVHCH
jgi:chromosome segregation ATPase